MNLDVDYWEYFSDFLGQCKKKLGEIKNLALVSKKVHRGVRLGATPYLRWKACIEILDSEVGPFWVYKIRAMTVRIMFYELEYMRLARPDISDLKLVVSDKTKEYVFAINRILSGIKKLHIFISDQKTKFDLRELPEGLEKFTIERPNPLKYDICSDLKFPRHFPSSVTELIILTDVDDDYHSTELPPFLVRLYYKSKHASFDFFEKYPDTIEDVTIIRKNKYGHAHSIEGIFPNLKNLVLIDLHSVTDCKIKLDRFPTLKTAIVTGLKIKDWSNRRIETLDSVILCTEGFGFGFDNCKHDAVKVVLKPNKKSRKC